MVVPTGNRLPLLTEAVDSVRCQTYCDWELVMVDDASEDATAEWQGGEGNAPFSDALSPSSRRYQSRILV